MITEILGWIQTILFTFMLVPQIIKTIKRKTVDDISITVSFIAAIAGIIALIYAIRIHQYSLIFKYIFGLLNTAIFVYLYYKYKGK